MPIANRSALKLFGVEQPEDVIGTALDTCVAAEDSTALADFVLRVPRMAVTLAREWLILVVMIALGFGWPAVLATAMGVEFSGDLYEVLFDPSDDGWWIAWLIVLAPYILVQFVRSLVWAVRISSR